jgi:hypothetical protein
MPVNVFPSLPVPARFDGAAQCLRGGAVAAVIDSPVDIYGKDYFEARGMREDGWRIAFADHKTVLLAWQPR